MMLLSTTLFKIVYQQNSSSSLIIRSSQKLLVQDDCLAILNKPLAPTARLTSPPSPPSSQTPPRTPAVRRNIVFTKSHMVTAVLVRVFTNHTVTKSYVSPCVGCTSAWRSLHVVSDHGRYAASDVDRKFPSGFVVRRMETAFEVLAVGGAAIAGARGDAEAVVVEAAADRGREGERVEVLFPTFQRSGT